MKASSSGLREATLDVAALSLSTGHEMKVTFRSGSRVTWSCKQHNCSAIFEWRQGEGLLCIKDHGPSHDKTHGDTAVDGSNVHQTDKVQHNQTKANVLLWFGN
jgi:hypothetical protein